MKRNLILFLSMILIVSLVLNGCQSNKTESVDKSDSPKKIAFVTGTGGLGDKSFNDLGYEGILKLKEEGIICDVAEPKAISDLEGIIRNFADTEEYALIVAMGGDSVDSVNAVSLDYPEQPMLIIDGFASTDTIKSVILSQTDTAFLVGAYAGLMEKEGDLPNAQGKNTIGIVGGMDIPIIRSLVAGYEAGARYVNPDIKVLVTYVGVWNDPGKGSELAQSLYSQGADIIFQAAGGSGLGVLEASEKVGLYALGYDGNQNSLYPNNILASGIRGLGDMVYTTAKDALNGIYKGGDFSVAMKDNPMTSQLTMVDSNLNTPDEILEKLEKIKEFLIEAKVEIPSEPSEVDAYINAVGSFEE
ncbi:BMP family ABC transporter substrate-binding protein [Tissierella praeacuta]|uniref:BMP family ABC transporter substrate-binding protein n=1 Tax=Tissierella praeacuta TaxID=43131 RepID=UPI00289851D1|nr:BMP family ABC transporter substrate-binding protein [Tissierella praeacuta]